MSIAETDEGLGLGEVAVKVRLHRARVLLFKKLYTYTLKNKGKRPIR